MNENQINNLVNKWTTSYILNKKWIYNKTNEFAKILNVNWRNQLEKLKIMNKIIKEPQYAVTQLKKDFYKLKWDIKKAVIKAKWKTIKDKWYENTTIKIKQWKKVEVDWHFSRKQYNSLKKQWIIK